MRFVTGESGPRADGSEIGLKDIGYHYRMNYPKEYRCEGLKIIKFEKNRRNSLEYEFIGAYPISVSAMPVSYDSSSLLKCSVSMTYLRYVITDVNAATQQPKTSTTAQKPDQENTQPPPVAQEKASDIQSTAGRDPDGNIVSGNIDSATGEGPRVIRTEEDLYSPDTKVGDKVVGPLAKELYHQPLYLENKGLLLYESLSDLLQSQNQYFRKQYYHQDLYLQYFEYQMLFLERLVVVEYFLDLVFVQL
jgi:hypothetical protein